MCRRGALAGIWRERAACSPAGGVNTMFPSDARGRRLAVRVSQARAQPSHGGGRGRVRPFCCVCAGGGVRHRKDQGVEAPWLPPPPPSPCPGAWSQERVGASGFRYMRRALFSLITSAVTFGQGRSRQSVSTPAVDIARAPAMQVTPHLDLRGAAPPGSREPSSMARSLPGFGATAESDLSGRASASAPTLAVVVHQAIKPAP